MWIDIDFEGGGADTHDGHSAQLRLDTTLSLPSSPLGPWSSTPPTPLSPDTPKDPEYGADQTLNSCNVQCQPLQVNAPYSRWQNDGRGGDGQHGNCFDHDGKKKQEKMEGKIVIHQWKLKRYWTEKVAVTVPGESARDHLGN